MHMHHHHHHRRDPAGGHRWNWKASFGPEGPFGPKGPFGPDGPFGPGGPFGGGRGHRRGRMFGHGELRLALLKLLAEEARHGYELIKAIEELTGGDYAPSPGAVYPTLQLLADEGLIEEQDDASPRKAFLATDAGRAELSDRSDEVEALFERLAAHGKRESGERSPHLWRAMGNLANVLRHRARAGKLDQPTIDSIVDMIDDMAKKIERL
ncbi:PadR family transcriptional regulator [Pelagerythrobacter marensis]|uniref:Transcriptional regulator n=1 Tax=Pelagerythrobacter marensis TaxID=543877 RepID=A0A0G3X9P0_9SPHN|nr:PadR family transcriptional regulator [Pelagerythrobacter marensis]AKM07329.1 transcriptional regulator [Pelagerythrobacter marensis]